jgi:hypothetical protein
MSLQPAKYTVCCAGSKQGLIGLVFLEETITNQQYLKQLQNDITPVAGHVDTTFLQQNGACTHTVNGGFDNLHDVFVSHVLSNRFPEHLGCGCFWPLCSPDVIPCNYFLWGYLKECVPHKLPHCSELAGGN